MLPRTMQEINELTWAIAGSSYGADIRLQYLHCQQLHSTRQARRVLAGEAALPEGWPLPHAFAGQCAESDVYEARITQLFFARAGFLVQVVLHEFIPDWIAPQTHEWRPNRQFGLLSSGWSKRDGVLFDLQLSSAAAMTAMEPVFKAACTQGSLEIFGSHQVGDDPLHWQFAAWCRRGYGAASLPRAIRRVAVACNPYVAAGFLGSLSLACLDYPRYFPPADEQFWASFPVSERRRLEQLTQDGLAA